MTINIKLPQNKNKKFIENFFIKKGLKSIVTESKKKLISNNKSSSNAPFAPELKDLYRLYQFIILNKRTTIMEFGSGWSSLVFNLALYELKQKFFRSSKSLRRGNLYELFVLENNKKYLGISKNRIKNYNNYLRIKDPIKINYHFSEVKMTLFNNRISTHYQKMPLCNPDFIYLDGPDQFNIKGNINGLSTRHLDLMPMSCDILKFEYFYIPGTIIVCDGRGANAKFLKDNLKRKWKYKNDKINDQHIFVLIDPSLGKYNNLQLNYYRK
mgnify:CR=1 FL=1|tara:strand:+ start:2862 stop:3668 length:807 start_codon:yes stop_codon:yes gene_type:complete